MKYINVVVDNKSNQTDSYYTYLAPDEVEIGTKLTVSFALRKKPIDAYCIETDVIPEYDCNKIKEIESYDFERSLNREIIETSKWMRKRYGVKYIDAIKMFTVKGVRELKNKQYSTDCYKPDFDLNVEQKNAVCQINNSIEKADGTAFLLKGVTNSGKTEVYMEAVNKALKNGKTAIVLLPEIALAAQVQKRFIHRFGEDNVATLHSKLSTSQKLTEWKRIKRGEAKIVVGARTSIFAPLDNIGVIVIDEEHESTYKSDYNPKFDTVDVAYKRASYNGATLILGSATPSVVSYYRAKKGIYKLVELNNRIGNSVMPKISLVDMKKEMMTGNMGLISRELAHNIDVALSNKEQIILFLNRRGYSTQIICPDCGYILTCKDCGISMTYHKSSNAAVCHYCGKKLPIPKLCPECGSKFVKFTGTGTEKIEETVKNMWPDKNIARFDLDTANSETDMNKVISSFQKGSIDILVGTQILAKGLDFRNVGLVGVLNSDLSLNIPDYRSAERTFQLITQVSGRAGRSGGNSKVIVQTYEPDSDVIINAVNGDFLSFYETEILHRSIMNYPPFSDIISLGFTEINENDNGSCATYYAKQFSDFLKSMNELPKGTVIMKPREEERLINGRKKVVFLIKAPLGSRSGFLNVYMQFRDKMISSKANCYIDIDINPY